MSQQNQIEQTKCPILFVDEFGNHTMPSHTDPFIDFFLEPFLVKQMFSKTNLKKKTYLYFATKNDSFLFGMSVGCILWYVLLYSEALTNHMSFLRFQTYLKKLSVLVIQMLHHGSSNGYVWRTHLKR